MKRLILAAAWVLSCAVLPAEQGTFSWSLLASGSADVRFREEAVSLNDGLLYNRGEFRLNFLPPSLTFRVEVLDRRPLNAWLGSLSGGSKKAVTNYLGALYHKTTGSRILFGALDEQGLPARIRNPWIRSPPFAESRKPFAADLKTSVSVTKNDEAYLYLSSPFLNVFQNTSVCFLHIIN
jgi:hypothetical protein